MSEPATTLIRDLPEHERPRERLAALGADALGDAELIAILLRTGLKGCSAVQVARNLLERFQTLDNLARAPIDELRKVRGIGRDKAIALKSAFTLAQRMAREIVREAPLMTSPSEVANVLRSEFLGLNQEVLVLALVNKRHRLIRVEQIYKGTSDTIACHASDIFRPAILSSAHGIIMAHNHPSGDPAPSEADKRMTQDICRAGRLLKIELLDHLIFGRHTEGRRSDFVSLRELGCFNA